jgi:hypothetical protein
MLSGRTIYVIGPLQLAANAGQIQRSKLPFGYDGALNVFSVAPG